MPAPTGQEPLTERILLRLTGPEKEYVVQLAQAGKTSINTALRDLINASKDRAAVVKRPPAEPPQTPPPAPQLRGIAKAVSELPESPVRPAQPAKKKGPRRMTGFQPGPLGVMPVFTEPEDIEGQTSILDDDQ